VTAWIVSETQQGAGLGPQFAQLGGPVPPAMQGLRLPLRLGRLGKAEHGGGLGVDATHFFLFFQCKNGLNAQLEGSSPGE
jgi:hypothetical protein